MSNLSTHEPVRLVLVPTWRKESDVIGLAPVLNRLDAINRLPGESVPQMVKRALHELRGAGVLLVFPVLKDVDKVPSM